VALGAVLATATMWSYGNHLQMVSTSDLWGPAMLVMVAFLMEVSSAPLRGGGAAGSFSFVVHLAALLLFGPFWAVTVVFVSTFLSQVVTRKPLTRIVFNPSQKVVSISIAAGIYGLLGGHLPPSYLVGGLDGTSVADALRDILAFLAGAVAYFGTNSYLVSWAVAISEGRSTSEIWKTNTLWVLGYDVGASSLAVLVAWLYGIFDQPEGLARFGFPAIFLPFIAIKHVYGKLSALQGLHEDLEAAHAQLQQTVVEQLEMMVRSIEARDPYTSGHSRRVSQISQAIAREYGLSEERVAEVTTAALLHDVGKIHAEFAPLLQKEGRLTPEEWEVMKTHAVRSADLVGLFSGFREKVQPAVRYHHERWDGLGYPDGVSGADIPLGSRIIMIADTIDAMTTDRPYRKALGFDIVVSELQKHRGTQFDPDLVDRAINSVSLRRLISDPRRLQADASTGAIPQRSLGTQFAARRLGASTASY
jgi:HD superfamily phosphohydrolase YqeK